MSTPGEIRILPPLPQWLRANTAMFFDHGIVSASAIASQVLAGAQVLGAENAVSLSVDEWSVVAADQDWFVAARYPVPESLLFESLTPFPEMGQNCTRPEVFVGVFARDIVMRKNSAVQLTKGTVSEADRIQEFLRSSALWRRAIAFRGVEA
jgi:hypothetical protein